MTYDVDPPEEGTEWCDCGRHTRRLNGRGCPSCDDDGAAIRERAQRAASTAQAHRPWQAMV